MPKRDEYELKINEKGVETPSIEILAETQSIAHPDEGLSAEEIATNDRKLLWKLDFTLIPWLCILYLLAFLDRTNIGNAKVAGLKETLLLDTNQYNATLSIFFISYALFEPLTNVLLKRYRPKIFIPATMVAWGLTMTFMGFVKNYADLLASRWFLGMAEAGLFPGVQFYLSCWYKRSEFGVRSAIFFSAAAFSGSFGGLLAAAIEKMNGMGGRPGWAWIFILEGTVTVLFGVASIWMVQDFPSTAKFLTDADRQRVNSRLKADRQGSSIEQAYDKRWVWQALGDYKTWLYMAIYGGASMNIYAFSLFIPSIIQALGYESTKAQLLTVPPYFCAAVLTIVVGYIADRTQQRGLCNICCSLIGISGFICQLAGESAGVKYFGLYLAAMGIYPCVANSIAWVSNNTEGVYKRGVVLGMVIGWGNINGLVASNIYRTPPKYVSGHVICLSYLAFFLLGGSIIMVQILKRENAKRLAGERDYLTDGLSDAEIEALGDNRPRFIYTL